MRSIFKYYLFFLLVLLVSCGVKKNVADNQEPVASTLEQRIASGEFAWLDTLQIETTNSVLQKKYSGNYILDHQNKLYGKKMFGDSIIGDSLILTTHGYYYKYKNDSLVDFGRFDVRNNVRFKICVEQNKLDLSTGELTDEIERVEKEIYGQGESLMDWYSYTHDYHCFWTVCRYNNNTNRQELEIIVDIYNDCLRFQGAGSNVIKWEKKL